MLWIEAHEQNVIHFSLRVPDSSQTTGGKVVGWKAKCGGDLQCHWGFRWQVFCKYLSRSRQRATRASVPLNVLENSLTLRSVALHLPIVASQARPRTETPLREAAENLGSRDSSIPKKKKKSCYPCKIWNWIMAKKTTHYSITAFFSCRTFTQIIIALDHFE